MRYLKEWTEIAERFDIATGYFEIGALLALDGEWQRLRRIRILMGAETTARTRRVILQQARECATEKLNQSIESVKRGNRNPFLRGVGAIQEALRTGQIECRIYDQSKFHAKAYITHAKLAVVGSQALVGSSNFTQPGLTTNIELNVQIQSAREVEQLQEWFDEHWAKATDVSAAVIATIDRHTRRYSPFEVYAKALQDFFRGRELSSTEWEDTQSQMFSILDRYQKEAYWSLMEIARQHQGAFLCDGVGLGKTFVGLMLIERLILHERKRVVLFAPKAATESVWIPHLQKWLPDIGGGPGSRDFSNLAVFNHTDLSRSSPFPERFERIAKQADAVVIDEAHHFRNPGRRGSGQTGPSRYHRLYDLLGTEPKKSLFMLTATPINNRLSDFHHLLELFTRRDEAYFARTLGIPNLRSHFKRLEKRLEDDLGSFAADQLPETQETLSGDEIFHRLVVQRSRAYAVASQRQEFGDAAQFPEREEPQVAAYSIRKVYGRLMGLFERAFEKNDPLFTLPMYYPLHWYRGTDTDIDDFEQQQNRQRQIVGLIRTNFLKRFESSMVAFEISCERLLLKLMAFVEVHSTTDGEKSGFERWKAQNADIIFYATKRRKQFWGEDADDETDEDVVPSELLEAVEQLNRKDYDVEKMIGETFQDLDQIIQFLKETHRIGTERDDKAETLIRLVKSDELAEHKVLIFTEFADTARYLRQRLKEAGVDGLDQLDGSSKRKRSEVIRCFSPYYNDSSTGTLAKEGQKEIRVLISTDVLSEGLNLQDASRMVNYDIHWNPVRLMQRIGRIDRRLDPAVERRMKADNPRTAPRRGTVKFWNFLPPDELNAVLNLYGRVTHKTLLISRTLGIEGRKLLTPDDDYQALKEFNDKYEGTRSAVEEMHLEYQGLMRDDPKLAGRLNALPGGIFSGRRRAANGKRGVFFCYRLPAFDQEKRKFTVDAGSARWYLYDADRDVIVEDPGEVIGSIRSARETRRRCVMAEEEILAIRRKVKNYIKNDYLKRIDAPIGVDPMLTCWMEMDDS